MTAINDCVSGYSGPRAERAGLQDLMEAVVRLAEQAAPGRRCALLLYDAQCRRLVPGHAPNLPAELVALICRHPPGADPAGDGAIYRRSAMTADIAADPAWIAHREAALQAGLCACWSEPILSAQGELLGRFAMYGSEPRAPQPQELQLVRDAALTLATGIQQRLSVDALLQSEARLEHATQRVQLLLEATDEGTIGLEPDGTVSFVNPAAMQLLGCTADQLLGRDFHSVIRHTREGGQDLIGHDSPIHRCLTEGRRHRSSGDDLFIHGERSFPVDFSVSPIMTGAAGEGAVLVFHDVSDKRTLSHQLNFQALHDPLTGLINRRGFEDRLTELLAGARQDGGQHALCYLDLDHFKLINDTCGHAAGDELLRQLPKLLQPLVRAQDTLARLGGDEFALLLHNCPLEHAARIAEKVRDAIKNIRFAWQYRSFTIGASIGVVGITAESHGLVSVLGAADAACYVAKDQGPNNIHVSYPHDLAIIRRRGEMRWIARLKSALEDNRFTLYYQSIQSLQQPQAAPLHHELLIRLLDAKDEVILPGAFIAAAERYQLMPQIDEWVVRHALQFLGAAVARQPQLARHRFGINLSGESLRDQRLLEVIRTTLAACRVSPTMLYFEITETAAISNLGAAVEFMQGLRQLGCQLALDDFGSGMSSFSYLKHLPVDYLKIDGSFIKDIDSNPVDQTIVRAINSVGQQMGIHTIAEFVETRTVFEVLRGIGVNYAQGFGIALPEPLEDFTAVAGARVAV